jgi:hypothetical protein
VSRKARTVFTMMSLLLRIERSLPYLKQFVVVSDVSARRQRQRDDHDHAADHRLNQRQQQRERTVSQAPAAGVGSTSSTA